MIMNVEYIWLTWLNEMQIISYCYVQIKVPPPSANDLNQLIYSRLPRPVPPSPRRFLPLPRPTPHRLEDFDPCLAPATETTAKSCARNPITLGWLLYTMLKPSKDQAYIWPYIWSNVTQKSPRKQSPHFGSLWQIVIDVTHEPDSSKSYHPPFYFFTGPFSTVPHLLLWISI